MNDKSPNTELNDKIRAALNLPDTTKIDVVMPQFNREDGMQVAPPAEGIDFANLCTLSGKELKALGFQLWDANDETGLELWLFPAEWYDHIPNDTIIWDFNHKAGKFTHGKTDNDRRFGALAYGVLCHSEAKL